MAKARLIFKKNKVKSFAAPSKRQKRLRWLLAGFLLLIGLNFAWDGHERKDQLNKGYELSKQYYDIISTEANNGFDRVRKQIDSIDKGKKE